MTTSAGRVEELTHTRRELDAARLEHEGLVGRPRRRRPLRRLSGGLRLRDVLHAALDAIAGVGGVGSRHGSQGSPGVCNR